MTLTEEFETAATKRMEEEGFMLYRRAFSNRKDDIGLTYCKMNNPKCCSVLASGKELIEATDVAALAVSKAETAIRYFKAGSK